MIAPRGVERILPSKPVVLRLVLLTPAYDNADAGANVRLIGEFPAQPAAEHPDQHQHRQPDEREKQINAVMP